MLGRRTVSLKIGINLRRAGCVFVFEHTPSGFSQISKKMHTSFPHMLWKFQTQVIQGQVTRSRQVTSHQEMFELAIQTPNARSPWNFQRLISVTVSIKCLSRNFDIGDPRSDQFCDFSITYSFMGEKWMAPRLEEDHSKHSQTSDYWKTWHLESGYCDQRLLLMSPRSFQVMKGHQQFFGNNFW